MRASWILLAVALWWPSLFALARASPQDVLTIKRLAPESRDEMDASLRETLEKVKSSFIERDSGKLQGCLGSAKIFVSLKSEAGKPGYYTSSQLLFIMERLFRNVTTRTFEYSPRDVSISEDGRAFLRSEWSYVILESDTLVSEHLHLSFNREKAGWRISEIKSSSR